DTRFGHLGRDVLLLAADERPDFVALQPLALQVAESAIPVAITGRAEFDQQALHGALLAAHHAADGADRTAFNEFGDDLGAGFDRQLVHARHYARTARA